MEDSYLLASNSCFRRQIECMHIASHVLEIRTVADQLIRDLSQIICFSSHFNITYQLGKGLCSAEHYVLFK